MDLQTILKPHLPEYRAHSRVLDLIDALCILHAGIGDTIFVIEKRWQFPAGDIAVLVERSRKNCAAVLPIPLWVISAAAEKREPKRCPRNNHYIVSALVEMQESRHILRLSR